MRGQMHVHAGWSRGYSFDDRFTEALDCLTAPPRLSFPVACDEVAGFGEVRWRRSIRSAMRRGGRAGEPGAETHGRANAVRRADSHPEDGRGLRGRGELGLSQEGRVLPSARAALGPSPDAHSASGPGRPARHAPWFTAGDDRRPPGPASVRPGRDGLSRSTARAARRRPPALSRHAQKAPRPSSVGNLTRSGPAQRVAYGTASTAGRADTSGRSGCPGWVCGSRRTRGICPGCASRPGERRPSSRGEAAPGPLTGPDSLLRSFRPGGRPVPSGSVGRLQLGGLQ